MDDKKALEFQSMAVRAMLKKVFKYALIVCGIAYLAGSGWWLLFMIPSSLLAVLRTNVQIGTGAYLTERQDTLRSRQEDTTAGEEDQEDVSNLEKDQAGAITSGEAIVQAEPADDSESYIAQVEGVS